MFSFLNKCCSSGKSCPYQNALDYCTYADWNAPSESYMQCIFKIYPLDVIECFKGKYNNVVRVQKAFLIFRTKFEKHQDKNNAAFRLKNLLILDRCTEEKCILDLIANYEYNRLFYDRNKADPSPESIQKLNSDKFIQQFICSYYLYIKKKADIYQRFPDELLDCRTRKFYLNNANNLSRIFEFIDFALQIQKLLNETNETLKKINKSPPLIQQILTYLLKAYIFLYTIVAISLQTLLGKLKNLKASELNSLQRLLKYFSRDFTNTFLNFLQDNKTIPAFKSIQYNEIIKIDQNYMSIFDKYYKLKLNEQSTEASLDKSLINTPTTLKSSIIDSQQFEKSVLDLPEQVFSKLSQQLKFKHQPRNLIQEVPSSDDHIFQLMFLEYKNYYSQDFIRDYNEDQNKQTTEIKQSPKILKKKSSKVQKKRSIMADLINSKDLKRMSMKQNLPTKNFKEPKWITWQNIYCQS